MFLFYENSLFHDHPTISDILNNANYNSREGFDGRECLLKSICENAVDSLFQEANGVYGELLHIVFT